MAKEAVTIAELRAEVERLRADAERYRWLRDNKCGSNRVPHICQYQYAAGLESVRYPHFATVGHDAAIDAARAALGADHD